MGRSASTLENMIGFDPITYAQRRQQLFNAPVAQAQNPYERMGAALGNILGGAVFGLEDPNLKRAADINRIYSEVMSGTDPRQPDFAERLGGLTQRLADAGYGDAAMYAANQARTLQRQATQDLQAEQRLRNEEYRVNPRLMLEDAAKLPDDDPRRKALIDSAYDRLGKEEADRRLREVQTREAEQRIKMAGQGRISSMFVSEDEKGNLVPLTEIAGVLYMPDGTRATKVRMARESEGQAIGRMLQGGGGAGTTSAKPTGERPPLSSFGSAGPSTQSNIPEVRRGLAGVLDERERQNPRIRTAPATSTFDMGF